MLQMMMWLTMQWSDGSAKHPCIGDDGHFKLTAEGVRPKHIAGKYADLGTSHHQ